MEASALIELRLGLPGQDLGVERDGLGSEETESGVVAFWMSLNVYGLAS